MSDLKFNINKVHIDLLLEYDEVKLEEKSNLKFGNYFEITTINEDKKELKMIISVKDIENPTFNWRYFSNPLDRKSDLVERNSNIFSIIHDVKDIFEKKRFSEDYLNHVNEDYLICSGEKVDAFFNEIKSDFGEFYKWMDDGSLRFLVSGDEETIENYKGIANKYGVEVKFEA